jgi:hypothetical protein
MRLVAEGLGEHNGINLIIVGLVSGIVFPLIAVIAKSGKK